MESKSDAGTLQRRLLVIKVHKMNMSYGVVIKQASHYDLYKLMHYPSDIRSNNILWWHILDCRDVVCMSIEFSMCRNDQKKKNHIYIYTTESCKM